MERTALEARLAAAFPEVAGEAVRVVRAPGRVNLIGEHTDYNDGFVLPVAIDLEARMAFVPTDDRRVEIVLADGSRGGFHLDRIARRRGGWLARLEGMAWSLRADEVAMRGFRGLLASDIPMGAGLSSSAAVEIAMAWALTDERPPLEPMKLAQAAQRTENDYIGVRTGLMDPFASAFGRRDAALLLDCRSLHHREVRLPLDRFAIVACDTRAPHRLEASEYNARRAQCEAAVAEIAREHPEVRSLRDVDAVRLAGAAWRLEPVSRRRAQHVVNENRRVLAVAEALAVEDLDTVGRLFAESHASLRDLYEVTSPELDALVEIATATPGVIAARMTGAGFGGCTVNIVERDAVEGLRAAIEAEYPRRTGRQPAVYALEAADGAGEIAA